MTPKDNKNHNPLEETKKATPEEINFMNSFIWFKPKYPNYEDVRLIMGRHISEVAGIPKNRRNPDFYERNLFLNPDTMEWEDWNELEWRKEK